MKARLLEQAARQLGEQVVAKVRRLAAASCGKDHQIASTRAPDS